MKQRIPRALVSAALAGAAALAASSLLATPAQAQSLPATTRVVPIADAVAADLQQQSTTLNDPGVDPRARDDAAERLMSRRSPEARQILRAALDNASNPKAQLSVAKAIAREPALDPTYVDSLFALVGQDRALSDAACAALAIDPSNVGILNRLIDLAQNQQGRESARTAAMRALGSFAEKRAASVLIDGLADDSNPTAVKTAAEDGLIALTGLSDNGHDASVWMQWWVGQNAKSDATFRYDLLASRSASVDRLRQQGDAAVTELRSLLNDQYQNTPDASKDALLLRWMRSAEPTVRQSAAEFVIEDFQNSRPSSAAVRDELRTLIGDSSPTVRLQAAKAVKTINDTGALDPLLTQLAQETVTENKAALATAVSQIPDLRSVPVLTKLLADDQPITVVEAAADGLANLGGQLFAADPQAAQQTAAALRRVLDDRTTPDKNLVLRESVVHALGPLRDSTMLTGYFRLLTLRESGRVRIAALQALGDLQNPSASGTIVDWLKTEPSPSVRVAAVAALRTTGSPEYLETLYQRMQPAVEPDATVRDQAWQVFASLLPQAGLEQVNRWPGRFQGDPDKRVVVLKILVDKLTADKKDNDVATQQENIGEALMKMSTPQPAEAATYFRKSLDYYQQTGNGQMIIERNIRELMDALLASKQYPEAIQFAGKMINSDPGYQQVMGPAISDETSRLVNDSGDLANAQKLIGEVGNMSPPLDSRYRNALDQIQQEITQRMADQKGKGGTWLWTNDGMRVT